MPIDPNIALGYRGVEAPNPLAQYAQVSQIQNAQNQNAMAQYQLAAAKRADEITNVQNELYAKHFDPVTGKLNQNALNADLIARNQAAQIPVIQAKQQELETKAATAQKTKIDAIAEERKFVEGAQRNLSTNPSDANITAWLEDSRLSPVLTAQTKAQLEKEAAKLLAMKPVERTAYLGMQGATTGDIVSKQNNAATVGATIRGQNLLDARAKENIQIAKDREARLASGSELKPVPVHAQKAITGAASTLGQLNKAIAELEANPNAVGWKGLTPDFALNRLDPEGTVARASLADIGSLKIHERSGAAVTASETPRLRPFIPSISDDYETALTKLKRMRDVQAIEQEVLTGTYNKEQGFRDFTAAEASGTPPAAAGKTVVTLPNGSSMEFPNAKAAAEFKKKAGL